MTQNEKDLLLKDLCARLPYRVMCKCDEIKAQGVLKEIGTNYNMCRLYDSFTDESEDCFIFDCRPYLFPLSSMTERQCYELSSIRSAFQDCWKYIKTPIPLSICNFEQIEWFHKNHLDYRGLIEKGLAIDATDKNIY